MTATPIPENGLLRLDQIIGNPQRCIPAILPVSRSTWYRGVRAGLYPQPIKLSERTVAWKASDILAIASGK